MSGWAGVSAGCGCTSEMIVGVSVGVNVCIVCECSCIGSNCHECTRLGVGVGVLHGNSNIVRILFCRCKLTHQLLK